MVVCAEGWRWLCVLGVEMICAEGWDAVCAGGQRVEMVVC